MRRKSGRAGAARPSGRQWSPAIRRSCARLDNCRAENSAVSAAPPLCQRAAPIRVAWRLQRPVRQSSSSCPTEYHAVSQQKWPPNVRRGAIVRSLVASNSGLVVVSTARWSSTGTAAPTASGTLGHRKWLAFHGLELLLLVGSQHRQNLAIADLAQLFKLRPPGFVFELKGLAI